MTLILDKPKEGSDEPVEIEEVDEHEDPVCAGCAGNPEWVYLGGPPTESGCATSDHKPRKKEIDSVRVAVVEIDGQFYDSDNGAETEESIRAMLAQARLGEDLEGIHEQIDADLNPKPWEGRESFYNTTRIQLNHGRELVIGEQMGIQMNHPYFTHLREWDWRRIEGVALEGRQKMLEYDREHRHWWEVVPKGECQQLVLYGQDIQDVKIEVLQDDVVGQLERSKRRFREDNPMLWSKDDKHARLSWIMCYDPTCRLHLRDKVNQGWFPIRKTYGPVTEIYQHEELQYWEIVERYPGYARITPARGYPITCVNGYVTWKQCQIHECKVHMRAKARKWWDDHERDRRIENMEYLIRPQGVYLNDAHNFITPEQDERMQQDQPEPDNEEYPSEVPEENW
jgi:hypothetical protein